ncbi:solute carrier family 22 member 16-like [Ornithodoros turicata]|uniref:solute carrier family 22 member 16-like n=1 Tax=Ornithodoros turicata TaxID=34597 RepID=UPI003139C50D
MASNALISAQAAGALLVLHFYAHALLAPAVDHWCKQPDTLKNYTAHQWKTLAIPQPGGHRSQCEVYQPPFPAQRNRSIVKCSEWEFAGGVHTIASEWNLVCGRKELLSMARALYIMSGMCSVPFWGHLTDTIGRGPMLKLSTVSSLFLAVAATLSWDFEAFLVFRTALAASLSLLRITTSVILYESSAAQTRDWTCCTARYGDASATIMLSALLHTTLDKDFVGVILLVPTALSLLYIFVTGEDHKSSIAPHQRNPLAFHAVGFTCMRQGVLYPERRVEQNPWDTITSTSGSLVFITPGSMLQRTLFVAWCTFVSVGSFAWISNSSQPLTNFWPRIFSALLQSSGIFVLPLFVERYGKKDVFMASLAVSAVLSALLCIFQQYYYTSVCLHVALYWNLSLAVCLVSVYNLDLFPAIARASGFSIGFFCARAAPLVVLVQHYSKVHFAPGLPFGAMAMLLTMTLPLVSFIPETPPPMADTLS